MPPTPAASHHGPVAAAGAHSGHSMHSMRAGSRWEADSLRLVKPTMGSSPLPIAGKPCWMQRTTMEMVIHSTMGCRGGHRGAARWVQCVGADNGDGHPQHKGLLQGRAPRTPQPPSQGGKAMTHVTDDACHLQLLHLLEHRPGEHQNLQASASGWFADGWPWQGAPVPVSAGRHAGPATDGTALGCGALPVQRRALDVGRCGAAHHNVQHHEPVSDVGAVHLRRAEGGGSRCQIRTAQATRCVAKA